jgi:hypothetical protein
MFVFRELYFVAAFRAAAQRFFCAAAIRFRATAVTVRVFTGPPMAVPMMGAGWLVHRLEKATSSPSGRQHFANGCNMALYSSSLGLQPGESGVQDVRVQRLGLFILSGLQV